MPKKIDIAREIETAQLKAQVINDLCWKAESTGRELDVEYVKGLSSTIDQILFKVNINLKKKEKNNAR